MNGRAITLLHTGDVHLGASFPGLGEKGRDHREQLKRTFARIVDLAIAERVDLVLIAGDLFDSHRQDQGTVAFVRDQFLRLREAQIRVCTLAGNHDRLLEDSVWMRARFPEQCDNVTLFGVEPASVTFADLDLTVIGQSIGPDGPYALRAWPRDRRTRLAVGLAHGSTYREGVVEQGLIHPVDIRALGLDYVALGDWHSPQQVTPLPAPAWYAGSPEFQAMDQESGHVILATIAAPGAAEIRLQRVGRRRYQRLEVDLSGLDLERVHSRVVAAADPDVILDVILTGVVTPPRVLDVRELEEALQETCFRVKVRDQSTLWLDEEALAAFPERTLVGKYIRLMQDRIAVAPPADRPVVEEALQVGIAMLLHAEGS